jgi:hypothetical protein
MGTEGVELFGNEFGENYRFESPLSESTEVSGQRESLIEGIGIAIVRLPSRLLWGVVGRLGVLRLGVVRLAAVLQRSTGQGTQQTAEGGAFETSAALMADHPARGCTEQGTSDGAFCGRCIGSISPGAIATAVTAGLMIGAIGAVRGDDAGAQGQAQAQGTKGEEARDGGHDGVKSETEALSDAGFRR